MVIILIAVVIIGFILAYTYVEMDRRDIQKKQKALQKATEELDARLKEQERLRHEEFMKKPYEGGV